MGLLGSLIGAIASIFGSPIGGLVGGFIGGMLEDSSAKKKAEAASRQQQEQMAALQRQAQPTMPDEEAMKLARRRSLTAQMARRGRASTILTNQDAVGDTLGA